MKTENGDKSSDKKSLGHFESERNEHYKEAGWKYLNMLFSIHALKSKTPKHLSIQILVRYDSVACLLDKGSFLITWHFYRTECQNFAQKMSVNFNLSTSEDFGTFI